MNLEPTPEELEDMTNQIIQDQKKIPSYELNNQYDILKKHFQKAYTSDDKERAEQILKSWKNLKETDKDIISQEKINKIKQFLQRYDEETAKKNLKEALNQQFKKEKTKKNQETPEIQLPQTNRTIKQFSEDISQIFQKNSQIFYKPQEDQIVEIKPYYDEMLRQEITIFAKVEPKRLLNIIEEKTKTYKITTNMRGEQTINYISPTEQQIKLLASNTKFIQTLNQVHRFMNYPLVFLNKQKKLIIPKKGYDKRFQAYFLEDTPTLHEMTTKEAKDLINKILSEFCFKEKIDKTIAISYLLTPACRGLYHNINDRTPLYIISANRERAGKDYLAGVVGILYEGRAIDDTPFVTGERNRSASEELRKKLTSTLIQGRRRIHSSNNKGNLNNAVLEQFLTSNNWTDRILGKNEQISISNEVDVSLSANSGLTYTPDIWYRARAIRLFYAEEDPNSRKYKIPNLHGYVKENREIILSAIYTLIKKWVEAKQPPGNTPFTSYPEWARVIGGIMQYHELGDPCTPLEDDAIGGDKETANMKKLFFFFGDYQENHLKREMTIKEMREIIIEKHEKGELDALNYMDFTQKKYQIRFGLLIKKFLGREFSKENKHYKLSIFSSNEASFRQTYTFISNDQTQVTKKCDVVDVSDDWPSVASKKKINNMGGGANYSNINNITHYEKSIKKQNNQEIEEINMDKPLSNKDVLIETFNGKNEVFHDDLLNNGLFEDNIKKFSLQGVIFEIHPGFWRLNK